MVLRDELNDYLAGLYEVEKFDDYCENGLQVEGKREIEKIVLGVSFNLPFLERAIEKGADAVIVHHGFFGRDLFVLKGPKKSKIKRLLEYDISLFGIHLPMDAHRELGHSALLLEEMGARITGPFEMGFLGENTGRYTLRHILEVCRRFLHREKGVTTGEEGLPGRDSRSYPPFSLAVESGFAVLKNGPDVPRVMAAVSGGGSKKYEEAVALGVDTFFSGEIKEPIPAVSLETGTNFVALGHYNSEKPGLMALKDRLREIFDVEAEFVEIPNPL